MHAKDVHERLWQLPSSWKQPLLYTQWISPSNSWGFLTTASYLGLICVHSFTLDTVLLPRLWRGVAALVPNWKQAHVVITSVSMCWRKLQGFCSGKRSKWPAGLSTDHGPDGCLCSRAVDLVSYESTVPTRGGQQDGEEVQWCWMITWSWSSWDGGQTGSRCLNDSEGQKWVMCTK